MPLSREQYNEIMRVISRRRSDAFNRQRMRQEEVEGQLPAVRVCNEELSRLNMEELKAGLGRGSVDKDRLKASRKELTLKKRRLLREAGFAEDYPELHFYCDKCKDTGYINNEKCGCLKRLETELLNRESGLPALLARENFGTFDKYVFDDKADIKELLPHHMTQYQYMVKKIMPVVQEFIEQFGTDKSTSLLMMGAPGTGKTFLSNCIAKTLIDRQRTVMYERAGDLIEAFSNRDFKRGGEEKEQQLSARIDRIHDAELLIIDDLGTEFTNDYSKSRLYEVIEGRLTRGKSTIISTNLSLNQLSAVYGSRVASRFIGGYRLLPFYGADLRIRKTGGEIG